MSWLIKTLFGGDGAKPQDAQHSEAIHRIEKALGALPDPSQARLIACLALLMARVCHVDHHISESEQVRIRHVLETELGLSPDVAARTLEIALESTRAGAVENHLLIRRLNELTDPARKRAVIRALLAVAAEDDITEEESTEIGLVASGLLLTRSEFIALRSEFREHLRVLKDHGRAPA